MPTQITAVALEIFQLELIVLKKSKTYISTISVVHLNTLIHVTIISKALGQAIDRIHLAYESYFRNVSNVNLAITPN